VALPLAPLIDGGRGSRDIDGTLNIRDIGVTERNSSEYPAFARLTESVVQFCVFAFPRD